MAFELIMLIFTLLNGFDTSAPNDHHLIATYVPIAQEQNGYLQLQQAGKKLVNDETITRVIQDWSGDLASQVCRQNAEALKYWQLGMKRPALQVPEVTGFDTNLTYLSSYRALARLASIQSRLHAEQGDLKKALDLAMDIIGFGSRQQNANGSLINHLVGGACTVIGINRIHQIVHDHPMSIQQLAALDRRLAEITITADGLKDALRTEYTISRNVVSTITSNHLNILNSDIPPILAKILPVMIKKHKTVSLFAETYGALLENTNRRVHDRQRIEVKKPGIGSLIRGNFIGETMHGMLVPALNPAIDKIDRTNTDLAFLRVQVAIKGFRTANNQAWPDTLQELVPQWINRLPEDPFSVPPAPINYSKKKRMLYSVGPDGIDNGGATLKQLQNKGAVVTQWYGVVDPSIVLDPTLLPKAPIK
ncbi:hypothetical protein BVX99_02730, partial [bacterium F16]